MTHEMRKLMEAVIDLNESTGIAGFVELNVVFLLWDEFDHYGLSSEEKDNREKIGANKCTELIKSLEYQLPPFAKLELNDINIGGHSMYEQYIGIEYRMTLHVSEQENIFKVNDVFRQVINVLNVLPNYDNRQFDKWFEHNIAFVKSDLSPNDPYVHYRESNGNMYSIDDTDIPFDVRSA